MIPPYTQEIQVTSYHCGSDCLLRPDAFLHLCQEIAESHAHREGFGYDWGVEKGLIWVMSQADILIMRRPRWKESLKIVTSTGAASGLLARRWVRLETLDGEVLMQAELQWLLIDIARRRPMPLRRSGLEIPVLEASMEGLPDIQWEEEMSSSLDYVTSWRDLDFHGHVNNASYLIWVLQQNAERVASLKRVQISFSKESNSDEALVIQQYQAQSDTSWESYKILDTTDTLRAEVRVQW